jgi:hypothetical protein
MLTQNFTAESRSAAEPQPMELGATVEAGIFSPQSAAESRRDQVLGRAKPRHYAG